MSDLGKYDRELLDLARDAAEPTSADRARVRAALAGRLGAAAGLGTAAGLGVSAKAAAAAGAGGGGGGAATAAGAVVKGSVLATKLIGTVIFVSAGVVGGTVAVHHARRATVAAIVAAPPSGGSAASRRRGDRAVREVPLAVPDQPEAPPAPPPEAPSEPLPEAQESARISRPTPAMRASQAMLDGREPGAATRPSVSAGPSSLAASAGVRRAPAVERSTRASSPEAPPAAERRGAKTPQLVLPSAREHVERSTEPPPLAPLPVPSPARKSGLADEASLVRQGVAAMRAGNPALALALFDAHARAYPHGVLAVEREAERALALADLDRPQAARAALSEFLRAHPDSPLIATVRQRLRTLEAAGAGTSADPPQR